MAILDLARARTTFRYALLACTYAAAAVLAWRALNGPIVIGWLHVTSPFALEGTIVVGMGLLYLLSCGESTAALKQHVSFRIPFWLVIVITASLFALNLNTPFISDDYILTRTNLPTPAEFARSFTTPGGDGSFRPLVYLYFGVMHNLFGFKPLAWHAVSLGIHLTNCWLVFAIAWLLERSEPFASMAALLFGIHGTRPEVVTWVADSSDLLAICCVLASICLFFSNVSRTICWPAALILLVLALLCKESAYAYPFILVCLAVAAGRFNRDVLAFVMLAVLICGALLAYRWSLFHGPGGYVDPSTGKPQILALHLLPTAKALLLRIWTILFFPINWQMHIDSIVAFVITIGAVGLTTAPVLIRLTEPRKVLALLGVVMFGTLPAIHLALIGDSILGSRILYLPALGFALLISMLFTLGRSSKPAVARLLCGLLATYFAGTTLHNLSAWRATGIAADQLCTQSALTNRTDFKPPATINGVFFFANGFDECIETKRQLLASH